MQALFLESPELSPYLVESFTQYYGSNLQAFQVLQDKWLAEMYANNESLCVNQAFKYYPKSPHALYTPSFLNALESDVWPEILTPWEQAIKKNIPLSNLPDVPYLSIQGKLDPIVTAGTQLKNSEQLCNQGKRLMYIELPGVNHFQVRQEGFLESNQWMKAILSHQEPETNC